MPDDVKTCPKCRTAMEAGWSPDYTYGVGNAVQFSWIPGEPVSKRSLLGSSDRVISPHATQRIPLIAYRCPQCALVEWYAPKP